MIWQKRKKAEQSIKKDYAKCKNVFINCSKMEDDAIEYMIQCYTSASQIKKNIKELMTIKDAATKLKNNQDAIVSSSQVKTQQRKAGLRIREKRQKNEESVTCETYITQVKEVDTYYEKSNLIGESTTIVTKTNIILKEKEQVCTSVQITKLKKNIKILVKVIIRITVLIEQYQKVLTTLTKTTLNLDSVQITTVTLPSNLDVVDSPSQTTAQSPAPSPPSLTPSPPSPTPSPPSPTPSPPSPTPVP